MPPQPVCGEGNRRVEEALKDQKLYDTMVDDFSMRSFVPSAGVSGHDQFFATFLRYNALSKVHTGEWLDEVATRAAAQNEQYLELMETPDFRHTADLANQLGWRDDLAQMRTDLLARGLREDVKRDRAEFDQAENLRAQREHCGQKD